eukprot:GHVN01013265.1.p1 GENE.GHVN01013265.1~~GHVN01013265.1.p1  ORF type:complete len:454 (+),score=23.83 GHVN01013265.1:131-1492(+)
MLDSEVQLWQLMCVSCVIILSTKAIKAPGIPWTYVWLTTTLVAWYLGTREGLSMCFVLGLSLNLSWYGTQYANENLWAAILRYWLDYFPPWCVGTLIRSGDILLHPLPLLYLSQYSHLVTVESCLYAFLIERFYMYSVDRNIWGQGGTLNKIYGFRPPQSREMFFTSQLLTTVGYAGAATLSAFYPILGRISVLVVSILFLTILLVRKRRLKVDLDGSPEIEKLNIAEEPDASDPWALTPKAVSPTNAAAWVAEMTGSYMSVVREAERHHEAFMELVDEVSAMPNPMSPNRQLGDITLTIAESLNQAREKMSDQLHELSSSWSLIKLNTKASDITSAIQRVPSVSDTMNDLGTCVPRPKVRQTTFRNTLTLKSSSSSQHSSACLVRRKRVQACSLRDMIYVHFGSEILQQSEKRSLGSRSTDDSFQPHQGRKQRRKKKRGEVGNPAKKFASES